MFVKNDKLEIGDAILFLKDFGTGKKDQVYFVVNKTLDRYILTTESTGWILQLSKSIDGIILKKVDCPVIKYILTRK